MRMAARWAVAAALVLLGGCGGEERDPAQDAQDVAQVKAMQTPPVLPHVFEPLGDEQIASHGLDGARCAFFEGEAKRPVAILKSDLGAMQVDGEVHRFAPDAGSAEGPHGTRTKYDGRELSLTVELADESEPERKDALLRVRDGYDRSVYARRGTLECSE